MLICSPTTRGVSDLPLLSPPPTAPGLFPRRILPLTDCYPIRFDVFPMIPPKVFSTYLGNWFSSPRAATPDAGQEGSRFGLILAGTAAPGRFFEPSFLVVYLFLLPGLPPVEECVYGLKLGPFFREPALLLLFFVVQLTRKEFDHFPHLTGPHPPRFFPLFNIHPPDPTRVVSFLFPSFKPPFSLGTVPPTWSVLMISARDAEVDLLPGTGKSLNSFFSAGPRLWAGNSDNVAFSGPMLCFYER